MTMPAKLRSIRNPEMRHRLAKDEATYVEAALMETHRTIHRLFPWPSRELEMVNRVSGFVHPRLRSMRGDKR